MFKLINYFSNSLCPQKPELKSIKDENIYSICILTSNFLVYGKHNGDIVLYNIEDKLRYINKAHEKPVKYLEAINFRKFISCSIEPIVKIWELNLNLIDCIQLKGVYTKHKDYVTKAIKLDEKIIITSSFDKTIRIWNIEEKKEDLLIIDKHLFGVISFIKLKDEELIISSDLHGILYFWKYNLSEHNYNPDKLEINCIALNQNSICEIFDKRVIVGGDVNFLIINIKTKQIELNIKTNQIINSIFYINNIIVLGYKNGIIGLFDKNSIRTFKNNKNKKLIGNLNLLNYKEIDQENDEILAHSSPIIDIKYTNWNMFSITNTEIKIFDCSDS